MTKKSLNAQVGVSLCDLYTHYAVYVKYLNICHFKQLQVEES